jgi:hypothetical protein
MAFFDPGTGEHIFIDGAMVERKAHAIVEKIKDYDERLEVLCLDPAYASDITEEPFIIGEVVIQDGKEQFFKIFGCWELNDAVLERIYLSDTRRLDVLARIDKINNAVKLDNERRYQERREASMDLVKHIVADKKSKYTFERENTQNNTKELVTIYDDRPSERKTL